MHILQLANFYGSTSGGLRIAIDELASRYLAAGAQVTTIVPGPRNSQRVDAHGRRMVEVRAPLVPGMGGYRVIVNTGLVERLIDEARPDVIELSDKTTLAAAVTRPRRDRPPVVLISHERLDKVVGQSFSQRLTLLRAIRAFNNRLADRVDAVVCCSDFAAEEFRRDGPPIHRIALGVDLDVFTPGPAPFNRRPQIVTVVRLAPDKDPMLLVETSRQLLELGRDHHWTVIGDGPLRPDLIEAARDLPVTFAGYERDRRLIAALVSQADVGVSPGPCETFGLAALELLACGTPVVVPSQGALRELVPDEAGRVCARTGRAFAHGILDLLDGDRAGQRYAARAHAERFHWDATTDRFLDLYDDVAAARRLATTASHTAAA